MNAVLKNFPISVIFLQVLYEKYNKSLDFTSSFDAQSRFYEWKKDVSKKQPYYVHFKDGRPLVFAALYDSWVDSSGTHV